MYSIITQLISRA